LDDLNTEHLKEDLKGRSVRGGALIATSQGFQVLLSMIFTVVLARLLTPSYFGLVAMVTAVTGLGQAFGDLGLSEATIQWPEITPDQVSALFWINSAIGLGLTFITMALAPLLAWFYREPRLIAITLVISPTFLIGGLRVQPDALLKRQMRFKSLVLRDVTSCFIGVLVAVAMAFEGGGYWAIIAFPLTVNSLQMASSWLLVNWRPDRPRRIADVGPMVSFGGHVAASYLIGSLSGNTGNILIGWYWAAGPLGLYSRASNLLMRPVNQILTPAGGVAIPTLSRIHGDPERYARYYLRAVNLIMWISVPLFGLLFVAAKPLIMILLGNKWQDAAPVFQLLCISALAQPLLQSTNWVLVSSGRTDRLFRLTLITSVVMIAAFAFSLPLGIKGVALWGSVVQLAMLPWMLKFCYRDVSLTFRALGRALLYPVSLGLLGVLSAEVALHFIASTGSVSALLVIALAFAAVYLVASSFPQVREEIMTIRLLLGDLRPSRQMAAPSPSEGPLSWLRNSQIVTHIYELISG
jgi:O-antigen/teichoic acid export membrane protein